MKNITFYNIEGQIITKSDIEYESARQEWNRSIQKYPMAIVYCENSCDVSETILYAREHCIPIRVRSGRHNYEGYSTGNQVIIIDVSRINNAKIDYISNSVTVGSGIRFGQLYNYISKQGYPFPGGACPTVGLSGYASGGGWGYSSRKLGLGCDSLLEIELVDYRGCTIKANKNLNKDLFWAVRGAGGGNFGVIVSMTFKLSPKVDNVTYVQIYYPNSSKKVQMKFFNTWQFWIDKVDNNINLNAGVYNTLEDGNYVYARGICYGDAEYTKKLLEPFYNIEGADITLEYAPLLYVINKIASSYPPYEYFKSPGRFVNKYYCIDEISNLVDIVNQERPEGSILTSINVYGLGGKVKDIPKRETAYYYRDAKYILLIQSIWEDNIYKKENVNWVLDNFDYIYEITEGSYINFPLLQLPDYEENYYGENIYKLKTIKEKYDPCNVFSFPQSIKNN